MSNTLLCVDDSVTMQTVAEITFRKSAWDFVGVRTSGEAKAAAGANAPSVILVDAVLADGSGYDLAGDLKAQAPGAIVLMMCGNSEAYDEGKGSAAGCDGHVVKPWQTDKVVEQIAKIAEAGPSAAAPVAAAPSAPVAKPAAPKPKADAGPPRSATLMGMPALEMPPSKPLPAGVAAIKPAAKAPVAAKPAIPVVKTPPPPMPSVKPAPVKPAAKVPTPAPLAAAPSVPTPVPAPAAPAAPAARKPMIEAAPGKPIRLVLASQAEAMAQNAATSGGMSSEQASALGDVSREMLERIIWEVVPDLAESIIRENLDTLTAKAR